MFDVVPTKVKYIGATPGADGNTYVLFNSFVSQIGSGGLAMHGIRKVVLDLDCNNAGTLKEYKSQDGSTWTQINQEAIAAPAATAGVKRDYPVGAAEYWKLEWVNGGVAQNPWDVDILLETQRAMA